jgi:hypothetical protein
LLRQKDRSARKGCIPGFGTITRFLAVAATAPPETAATSSAHRTALAWSRPCGTSKTQSYEAAILIILSIPVEITLLLALLFLHCYPAISACPEKVFLGAMPEPVPSAAREARGRLRATGMLTFGCGQRPRCPAVLWFPRVWRRISGATPSSRPGNPPLRKNPIREVGVLPSGRRQRPRLPSLGLSLPLRLFLMRFLRFLWSTEAVDVAAVIALAFLAPPVVNWGR